jgi:DNA-binding beta-propeller fold protein YncE
MGSCTAERLRTRHLRARRLGLSLGALLMSVGTALAQVNSSYLYTLSNFSGKLRYDWVRISVDPERDETYVLYQNIIRIFNANGMETFSFGDDLDLGHILDASVDERGDVILLSYKESQTVLTRCNFRGVPVAPVQVRNLPADVTLRASRLIHRGGLNYLVSLATSSVIVADADWEFRQFVDLQRHLDPEDKSKGESEVVGFTVDRDGNMFFTIPTLFKVFKVSPDGTVTSFGKSGSGAGKFGVIAGVAVDSRGNVLVVDKLKCVVIVFDPAFNFLREFGYRGLGPGNLIAPDDIAIDSKDRIYVSQGRKRGVSVFALSH